MRYPIVLKATARWIVVLVLTAILVSVVGWSWLPYLPSYTQRSLREVRHVHSFASPDLVDVLEWLDTNVNPDAVVAAGWGHGSLINLVANRATIVDDEQINYWIYLMARHLMLGQDDKRILEFLASHNTTHLLLSSGHLNILSTIGYIGSGVELDRFFALPVFYFQKKALVRKNLAKYYYTMPNTRLLMHEPLRINGLTYLRGDWQIQGIMLQCEPSETEIIPRNLDAYIIVQAHGQIEPLILRPDEILWNRKIVELDSQSSVLPIIPCTLFCSGDATQLPKAQIGLLSNTARKSLMIRLFVLGDSPPYLKEIYPTPGTPENTTYRVWEIEYPEWIAKNPDFVKTNFSPGPLLEAWLDDQKVPPTRYESGNPSFYLNSIAEFESRE